MIFSSFFSRAGFLCVALSSVVSRIRSSRLGRNSCHGGQKGRETPRDPAIAPNMRLKSADLVRPPQDGARGAVLVEGLGLDRRHGAQVHLAGRAVDGDLLALFDRLPAG